MRFGAPLFVADAVLDEAGTLPSDDPTDSPDDSTIDEAVDEFRFFLDQVDPSEFATGPDDSGADRSADEDRPG